MLTITDKEFTQLSNHIKANYGINLKPEKRALVMGRLYNVLVKNNLNSFSEYYDYLITDKSGSAAAELINKITTNHTFFMREPDHFFYFRDVVLPYLKSTVQNRDIRIWSAGCSSGEEPYTLAMLIDEFFGREKPMWDTKILATDISTEVLDEARAGLYTAESVAPLPSTWKMNYFTKAPGDNYAVTDKLKNEVIYRKLNLMDKSFPFKKKFHVIYCRNVMIYFDAEMKRELINRFYEQTEYGGYLFIGHSESIVRDESSYRYIKPALYRKTDR